MSSRHASAKNVSSSARSSRTRLAGNNRVAPMISTSSGAAKLGASAQSLSSQKHAVAASQRSVATQQRDDVAITAAPDTDRVDVEIGQISDNDDANDDEDDNVDVESVLEAQDAIGKLPPSKYASNASLLPTGVDALAAGRVASTNGDDINSESSTPRARTPAAQLLLGASGRPSSVQTSASSSTTNLSVVTGSQRLDSSKLNNNLDGVRKQGSSSLAHSLQSLAPTVDLDGLDPVDTRDQGRVKVFVRVRPSTEKEVATREPSAVTVSADNSHIVLNDSKKDSGFSFDHVFSSDTTNKEIFDIVGKPIVHAALNGFNGTLMAYGQTGTGKTHTLSSADGMTPRLIAHLFSRIRADKQYQYKVRCSYMQIYNEKIYDLLATPPAAGNSTKSPPTSPLAGADDDLPVRESAEKGIFVEGLTEYIARTPRQVLDWISLGKSRLVVAETKMNRSSSRSHAICFLTVERSSRKEGAPVPEDCVSDAVPGEPLDKTDSQIDFFSTAGNSTGDTKDSPEEFEVNDNDDDDQDSADGDNRNRRHVSDVAELINTAQDIMLRGRITICDLAGSERIKKTLASGTLLTEAQQINLSLLELGNVISALAANKAHIPFRNSTLTRLMQESLGGNCKTRLIVCVAPGRKDVSESKGTLAFGFRAMRVSNNARVNVEVDYKALVDSLAEQMRLQEAAWHQREQALLAKLEALTNGAGGIPEHPRLVAARLEWHDATALLQAASVICYALMRRDPAPMTMLSATLDPVWDQFVTHDSISKKSFSRTYKVLETAAHYFAKHPRFPPATNDVSASSVMQSIQQHCLVAERTLRQELHESIAWCRSQVDELPGRTESMVCLLAVADAAEKILMADSNINNTNTPASPTDSALPDFSAALPSISAFLDVAAVPLLPAKVQQFTDFCQMVIAVPATLFAAIQQIQLCMAASVTSATTTAAASDTNLHAQFEQLTADFNDLQTRHNELLVKQQTSATKPANIQQLASIREPTATQTDPPASQTSDTTQTDLTCKQMGDLEDELLDQKANQKAAACRVGGTDCVIM